MSWSLRVLQTRQRNMWYKHCYFIVLLFGSVNTKEFLYAAHISRILLSESNYQGSIQAWKIFLIFGLCSSFMFVGHDTDILWSKYRVEWSPCALTMAMVCELVWMTFNRLITLLQHSDNEWIKYQFATEQQTWYIYTLYT